MFLSFQVYVQIKDSLENFFHEQGITIVTIQPEFNPTEPSITPSSSNRCLFECQNLECSPKTCCSTDNLDTVVVDTSAKAKKCKHKYLKPVINAENSKTTTDKKCHSFLSLNVASLSNAPKSNSTATHDALKKSISESHVDSINMNPNGRVGKRLSDTSLTESCTSECDENVLSEAQNRYDDTIPDKYMSNYVKKLEAETRNSTKGHEEKGLLNAEVSLTRTASDAECTEAAKTGVQEINTN